MYVDAPFQSYVFPQYWTPNSQLSINYKVVRFFWYKATTRLHCFWVVLVSVLRRLTGPSPPAAGFAVAFEEGASDI